MALAPPAAIAQPPGFEPAPLLLPSNLRLTPEQFEQVCQANPQAVLELTAEGILIVMTPTGGETGARSLRLGQRLLAWADGPGDGAWVAFDSSTGFQLADGSVLSPDLSLLRRERWQALSPDQRRRFPPLCPDLVVELVSPSDTGPRSITALRRKMDLYQANGARLGWLLLPQERGDGNLTGRPAGDGAAAGERQATGWQRTGGGAGAGSGRYLGGVTASPCMGVFRRPWRRVG
jgi:Uma2 family endonuclease